MNSKIIFLCIHVLQILLLEYHISTKDFSGLNQEYEIILIDKVKLRCGFQGIKALLFKRTIQILSSYNI